MIVIWLIMLHKIVTHVSAYLETTYVVGTFSLYLNVICYVSGWDLELRENGRVFLEYALL